MVVPLFGEMLFLNNILFIVYFLFPLPSKVVFA